MRRRRRLIGDSVIKRGSFGAGEGVEIQTLAGVEEGLEILVLGVEAVEEGREKS